MIISLIVAVSKNGVIGVENRLPWRLPEDLKRFKQLTLGHPILMGRKTFESIGRPLPGRTNIVISRRADFQAEGVLVAHSLEDALAQASRLPAPESSEIFVIGGAEIYALALPSADRLYLTEVEETVKGDAFFPAWRKEDFREICREPHESATGLKFSFITWERSRS